MRYYVIYSFFCTVMYVARGSAEVFTDSDVKGKVEESCPIDYRSSFSHQSRQLLDYQPSDDGNYHPAPDFMQSQWDDYADPRRSQMIAQRRQINNRQRYLRQQHGVPQYYNQKFPIASHRRPIMKRWDFFHSDTPNSSSFGAVNNSSTLSTDSSKNNSTRSVSMAPESVRRPVNSSTSLRNDSTFARYPSEVRNRQSPVWQVPNVPADDGYSSGNLVSSYDAYDDGNPAPEYFKGSQMAMDEVDDTRNRNQMDSLEQPKVKRGFRLLPVDHDLYLLREENNDPGVDGMNDQFGGVDRELINSKRSNLDVDDRKDETSAMLAFKAHMHHSVRDIGKSFLQRAVKKDQLSSASDLILEDPEFSSLYEEADPGNDLYNPVLDSSPTGSLQSASSDFSPFQRQRFQYQDPVPSDSGSYDGSKSYESNLYPPVPLQETFPVYSSYQTRQVPSQDSYPMIRNDYYPSQNQPGQFQLPYEYNSLKRSEEENLDHFEGDNSMGNKMNDLERGIREDSGDSDDFNLGYLDKYARAVESLNDNWDSIDKIQNDGGSLMNVEEETNSGVQLNTDDNNLKSQDNLLSLEGGVNSAGTARTAQANSETVNETTLAMVIEPLTVQLQRLLSSIKQVNEKLISDGKDLDDTSLLDSSRRKRGIVSREIEDIDPEDDFEDEFDDDDAEEYEDIREERSDESSNDSIVASTNKSPDHLGNPQCIPGTIQKGKPCQMLPEKSDKKIGISSSSQSGNPMKVLNSSADQKISSARSEDSKGQKKRNNGIVSFFEKTLGIGNSSTTLKPTWNTEMMSTDSQEMTTANSRTRQEFIETDFGNVIDETKARKTSMTRLIENPVTSRSNTTVKEEQGTNQIAAVTQNNFPTRAKAQTIMNEVKIETPAFAKSETLVTDEVIKAPEITTEGLVINLGTAMSTLSTEITTLPVQMSEVWSKPPQGARGRYFPPATSATYASNELETMKVSIIPITDFPNQKSNFTSQFFRTNSTDLLARLLPQEIIQNITSDGIIVKLPYQRSEENKKHSNSKTQSKLFRLNEEQGQSKNSGQQLLYPSENSDEQKELYDGNNDAMVAVSDDDEEENDTKLTIKLRLPNRGHSALHHKKVVERNSEKLSQGSAVSKEKKSLNKRYKPFYHEVDDTEEDSFGPEEDEDDISINDDHDTEKRDAEGFNEYEEDAEEDEEVEGNLENDVGENGDENQLHRIRKAGKELLKRSEDTLESDPNSSSNFPKIVLRLRLPEAAGKAPNIQNPTSSLASAPSTPERLKRIPAMKKISKKFESRPNSIRIGRSLKWVADEPEVELRGPRIRYENPWYRNRGNERIIPRNIENSFYDFGDDNDEMMAYYKLMGIKNPGGNSDRGATTTERFIREISSNNFEDLIASKSEDNPGPRELVHESRRTLSTSIFPKFLPAMILSDSSTGDSLHQNESTGSGGTSEIITIPSFSVVENTLDSFTTDTVTTAQNIGKNSVETSSNWKGNSEASTPIEVLESEEKPFRPTGTSSESEILDSTSSETDFSNLVAATDQSTSVGTSTGLEETTTMFPTIYSTSSSPKLLESLPTIEASLSSSGGGTFPTTSTLVVSPPTSGLSGASTSQHMSQSSSDLVQDISLEIFSTSQQPTPAELVTSEKFSATEFIPTGVRISEDKVSEAIEKKWGSTSITSQKITPQFSSTIVESTPTASSISEERMTEEITSTIASTLEETNEAITIYQTTESTSNPSEKTSSEIPLTSEGVTSTEPLIYSGLMTEGISPRKTGTVEETSEAEKSHQTMGSTPIAPEKMSSSTAEEKTSMDVVYSKATITEKTMSTIVTTSQEIAEITSQHISENSFSTSEGIMSQVSLQSSEKSPAEAPQQTETTSVTIEEIISAEIPITGAASTTTKETSQTETTPLTSGSASVSIDVITSSEASGTGEITSTSTLTSEESKLKSTTEYFILTEVALSTEKNIETWGTREPAQSESVTTLGTLEKNPVESTREISESSFPDSATEFSISMTLSSSREARTETISTGSSTRQLTQMSSPKPETNEGSSFEITSTAGNSASSEAESAPVGFTLTSTTSGVFSPSPEILTNIMISTGAGTHEISLSTSSVESDSDHKSTSQEILSTSGVPENSSISVTEIQGSSTEEIKTTVTSTKALETEEETSSPIETSSIEGGISSTSTTELKSEEDITSSEFGSTTEESESPPSNVKKISEGSTIKIRTTVASTEALVSEGETSSPVNELSSEGGINSSEMTSSSRKLENPRPIVTGTPDSLTDDMEMTIVSTETLQSEEETSSTMVTSSNGGRTSGVPSMSTTELNSEKELTSSDIGSTTEESESPLTNDTDTSESSMGISETRSTETSESEEETASTMVTSSTGRSTSGIPSTIQESSEEELTSPEIGSTTEELKSSLPNVTEISESSTGISETTVTSAETSESKQEISSAMVTSHTEGTSGVPSTSTIELSSEEGNNSSEITSTSQESENPTTTKSPEIEETSQSAGEETSSEKITLENIATTSSSFEATGSPESTTIIFITSEESTKLDQETFKSTELSRNSVGVSFSQEVVTNVSMTTESETPAGEKTSIGESTTEVISETSETSEIPKTMEETNVTSIASSSSIVSESKEETGSSSMMMSTKETISTSTTEKIFEITTPQLFGSTSQISASSSDKNQTIINESTQSLETGLTGSLTIPSTSMGISTEELSTSTENILTTTQLFIPSVPITIPGMVGSTPLEFPTTIFSFTVADLITSIFPTFSEVISESSPSTVPSKLTTEISQQTTEVAVGTSSENATSLETSITTESSSFFSYPSSSELPMESTIFSNISTSNLNEESEKLSTSGASTITEFQTSTLSSEDSGSSENTEAFSESFSFVTSTEPVSTSTGEKIETSEESSPGFTSIGRITEFPASSTVEIERSNLSTLETSAMFESSTVLSKSSTNSTSTELNETSPEITEATIGSTPESTSTSTVMSKISQTTEIINASLIEETTLKDVIVDVEEETTNESSSPAETASGGTPPIFSEEMSMTKHLTSVFVSEKTSTVMGITSGGTSETSFTSSEGEMNETSTVMQITPNQTLETSEGSITSSEGETSSESSNIPKSTTVLLETSESSGIPEESSTVSGKTSEMKQTTQEEKEEPEFSNGTEEDYEKDVETEGDEAGSGEQMEYEDEKHVGSSNSTSGTQSFVEYDEGETSTQSSPGIFESSTVSSKIFSGTTESSEITSNSSTYPSDVSQSSESPSSTSSINTRTTEIPESTLMTSTVSQRISESSGSSPGGFVSSLVSSNSTDELQSTRIPSISVSSTSDKSESSPSSPVANTDTTEALEITLTSSTVSQGTSQLTGSTVNITVPSPDFPSMTEMEITSVSSGNFTDTSETSETSSGPTISETDATEVSETTFTSPAVPQSSSEMSENSSGTSISSPSFSSTAETSGSTSVSSANVTDTSETSETPSGPTTSKTDAKEIPEITSTSLIVSQSSPEMTENSSDTFISSLSFSSTTETSESTSVSSANVTDTSERSDTSSGPTTSKTDATEIPDVTSTSLIISQSFSEITENSSDKSISLPDFSSTTGTLESISTSYANEPNSLYNTTLVLMSPHETESTLASSISTASMIAQEITSGKSSLLSESFSGESSSVSMPFFSTSPASVSEQITTGYIPSGTTSSISELSSFIMVDSVETTPMSFATSELSTTLERTTEIIQTTQGEVIEEPEFQEEGEGEKEDYETDFEIGESLPDDEGNEEEQEYEDEYEVGASNGTTIESEDFVEYDEGTSSSSEQNIETTKIVSTSGTGSTTLTEVSYSSVPVGISSSDTTTIFYSPTEETMIVPLPNTTLPSEAPESTPIISSLNLGELPTGLTSTLPWETNPSTAGLTSVITEYEPTNRGMTKGEEISTRFTEESIMTIPQGLKGKTSTSGFSWKNEAVPTTTEIFLNISIPGILIQPEDHVVTDDWNISPPISQESSSLKISETPETTEEKKVFGETSSRNFDTTTEKKIEFSPFIFLEKMSTPGTVAGLPELDNGMLSSTPEKITAEVSTEKISKATEEITANFGSGGTDLTTKIEIYVSKLTSQATKPPEVTAKFPDNAEKESTEFPVHRVNPSIDETEEELELRNEQQAAKRDKLQRRVKVLKDEEKALREKERELKAQQKELQKEEARRQRERNKILAENKKKLTTTTIEPTTIMTTEPTTIDYEKLRELEEMKEMQEKMEAEVHHMEEKIAGKEQAIEKKMKKLELEEKNHQKLKEKLKKIWSEQEEKNLKEKEKEIEEKKQKLYEEQKKLEEDKKKKEPFDNEDDETTSAEKSDTLNNDGSTERNKATGNKPGVENEDLDETSHDYIFDKEEEVWKEKHPNDSDREVNKNESEDCDTPNYGNVEQAHVATKRVYLNVLENDDSDINKKDFVTKVVCLPHHSHSVEPDRQKFRKRRKLLNLEDTPNGVSRVPIPKISSSPIDDKWASNSKSVALHTPESSARVHENWSEMTIHSSQLMNDSVNERFPAKDEIFIGRHLNSENFEDRSRPIQIGRLSPGEWVEVTDISRNEDTNEADFVDEDDDCVLRKSNSRDSTSPSEDDETVKDKSGTFERAKTKGKTDVDDDNDNTVSSSSDEENDSDHSFDNENDQEDSDDSNVDSEVTQETTESDTDSKDMEYVSEDETEDSEDGGETENDQEWNEYPNDSENDDQNIEDNESEPQKRSNEDSTALKILVKQATNKILKRKDNDFIERERSLREEEKQLENEEKELEEKSVALEKSKKSKDNRSKRRVELIEDVISWLSEGTGRYHIDKKAKWDTNLFHDALMSFEKNEQTSTVNVLHLEYDSDGKNHRSRYDEPEKEGFIIVRGPGTEKYMMMQKSLADAGEKTKVYYDPQTESNIISNGDPNKVALDADGAIDVGRDWSPTKRSQSWRTTKLRHPPGTEWPTEKTTKFHLGGTDSWDKELASTLDGGTREKRKAGKTSKRKFDNDSQDDFDDEDDKVGTTCYTMVVRKGQKSSGGLIPQKSNRDVENQIELPEYGENDDYMESVNKKPKLRTIKSFSDMGEQSDTEYIQDRNGKGTELRNFNMVASQIRNSSDTETTSSSKNIFTKFARNGHDSVDSKNREISNNVCFQKWWHEKETRGDTLIDFLRRRILALAHMNQTQMYLGNSTSVENIICETESREFERESIGRSLLAVKSHKKKFPHKKMKSKGKKKSKKLKKKPKRKKSKNNERIAKRDTDRSRMLPHESMKRYSGVLGEVQKPVLKQEDIARSVEISRTKEPRSIFDKMKQMFNNVIGQSNTTPDPSSNYSEPEEDYTEIVHDSAKDYEDRTRKPVVESVPEDESEDEHVKVHRHTSKMESDDDGHHDHLRNIPQNSNHHKRGNNHEKHHYKSHSEDHENKLNYNDHHDAKKSSFSREDRQKSVYSSNNIDGFVKSKEKMLGYHDSIISPLNFDKGTKRNVIFQNSVQKMNISSIIPKVKNIVESQNLGNVEKIIVYVDKNEGLVRKKKKRNSQNLAMKKEKKNSAAPSSAIKEQRFPALSGEEVLFDGGSLDEMISHVADKILKSVAASEKSSQILDPRLSVKVIQEVANGTELPHEETKTEFTIDLSNEDFPREILPIEKHSLPSKSVKTSSKRNSSPSRLTSRSTQRKMNLPGVSKKKRSHWKSKIKRENIAVEIKDKLMKELIRKLRAADDNHIRSEKSNNLFGKLKRKVSIEKVNNPNTNHHVDDIDEKIHILYALHHQEGKRSPENSKKKRGNHLVNHSRTKRENNWQQENFESKVVDNENDKKSLRVLVDQIINLQKNVNTTLQIIRGRLKDSPKEVNVTNSVPKRKLSVPKSSKLARTNLRPLKIEIRSSYGKRNTKNKPKKNDRKREKKVKKMKKTSKPKEKDHPPKRSHGTDARKKSKSKKPGKKNKSPTKKKQGKKSNGKDRIDEVNHEIQEILKEESGATAREINHPISRSSRRFKRRSLQGLQNEEDMIDENFSTNSKIGRHLCSKTANRGSKSKKPPNRLQKKTIVKLKNSKKLKNGKSERIKVKKASKKLTKPAKSDIRQVEPRSIRFSRESELKNVSSCQIANEEDCSDCICDLENALSHLKKMLFRKNDLLDRISSYTCDNFVQIGDEIVLSSSRVLNDVLPRSRRELAEAKGLKYIKPGDLEDVLRFEEVRGHEREVLSFPGSDLHIPCSHENEEITWIMSLSRPNYTWIRSDGLPISGTIRKNGNLELYDVDTKDAGNYSCIVSYLDPDNEELVRNVFEHKIQVVTLPRYSLRGGNTYKIDECDEVELDAIAAYLPEKLNEVLCQNGICDAFIFAPHCTRQQVSIKMVIVPASMSALFPIGASQCGLRCRKAVQDKVSLLLSRNLRVVLKKIIAFRLPNRRQNRLVPMGKTFGDIEFGRREGRNIPEDEDGQVGLLVGCPAGYGLKNSHCVPCSAGFHSQDLSSRCKKCPEGSYQPGIGARICRACENPFVEGCYGTIWTSSFMIFLLFGAFLVIIIISMVVRRIACFRKTQRLAGGSEIGDGTDADSPLISSMSGNFSDDDESIWEKPKKRKRNLSRKFSETTAVPNIHGVDWIPRRKTERGHESQRLERVKTIPVCCIDSYRSHGGHCRECKQPYTSEYYPLKTKPPVPFPDFDR